MNYIKLIIAAVAIVAVFGFLWRKGYLERLKRFCDQTVEELRKCSWPSKEELRGSTIVVMVSIALVGFFTVAADFLVREAIRLMM